MGKLGSFLKPLKKGANITTDTVEIDRDRCDDYAVEKKSTSFYVVSMVVSVLGAVLIWLFAVSTGMSEKMFSVQPEMRDMLSFVSEAELSGFTVIIDESAVNFALEGRQKVVNDVTSEDIAVYVDFGALMSEVHKLPNNTEQVLTAEIVIDAPIYFGVTDVSKKEITIKLVPINKSTME